MTVDFRRTMTAPTGPPAPARPAAVRPPVPVAVIQAPTGTMPTEIRSPDGATLIGVPPDELVEAPRRARRRRPPALLHNASALMISTIVSSVVGFLFWVVAARWFPAQTVGQASALVSSMTFLAAIAQLNLASLYARFLPTAGARTLRLVLTGAAAAAGMAVLATVAYLLVGPGTTVVGDNALIKLFFGVAVVASALTFISDGALIALGQATWVPAKNVATAVAKLALVVGLGVAGATAAGFGLLAAWAVPVIASVIVVAIVVVRRFAPAHAAATRHRQAPLHRAEVARFVTAEYVNSLVSNTVAFVPPVLVSITVGAVLGAYFYIPWLVGVAATTLLWNVVTSFVVAASGEHGSPRKHLTHSIRLGAVVSGGGALVLVLGAGPLLSLLGPGYAAHGATAMRLIGASLPFTALLLLFAAFCLMDKRVWGLTAVQLTGAALFLGGSWVGLSRLGITAPALAYLVSQAAVALFLLPALIRRYRRFDRTDPSGGADPSDRPGGSDPSDRASRPGQGA
jgi:O-antigen/teichoic acid export membrane protein